MIQLTLNLRSKRPNRVYDINGKSYRLQPGSNKLNLEYEDYLALAKALHITPIKSDVENSNTSSESEQETSPKVTSNAYTQAEPIEQPSAVEESHTDESTPSIEDNISKPDYSTWSTTKLKAEYKSITGNNCKLKKDEIISFLQEHSKNA